MLVHSPDRARLAAEPSLKMPLPRLYAIKLARHIQAVLDNDNFASQDYTNMANDTSTSLLPDDTIDVRGLQCPLPVLKARKRLKAMKENGILEVIATDPAAVIDFPHFCNEAGHDLLSTVQNDGELIFIIRKSHE